MKNLILTILCLATMMTIFIENIDAKIDPDSIVGIWLLDEEQGDTVKDSSGNRNDRNIINAKWTDGKFGKAKEIKCGC